MTNKWAKLRKPELQFKAYFFYEIAVTITTVDLSKNGSIKKKEFESKVILTNQSNQARRRHQERCTWGHCFAYIYFKQENKPFLVKSARALKRYENFFNKFCTHNFFSVLSLENEFFSILVIELWFKCLQLSMV